MKVVLNTIPPDSLRRINKINIGGNLKASNEQLPLESGIDDFGFDIDRDLIGTITGRSEDEDLATGIMTGGDLLSLTMKKTLLPLQERFFHNDLCGNRKVGGENACVRMIVRTQAFFISGYVSGVDMAMASGVMGSSRCQTPVAR